MLGFQFVKRVDAAAEEAARNVVATARQCDTPIIVWADGETIEIDPFTERRVQPSLFDEGRTELSGDSPLEVV
ncbi:MAG TPA: hypothetical protein VM260_10900 [Pirellula sp.]|nr:hypothetical protein [Pirellula sp.]